MNRTVRPRLPKVILAASLLFVANAAQADGIPFDVEKGRVTEPHQTLKLSAEQKAEVTSIRQLTLSDAQLKRLRDKCPTFPQVMPEVLSFRHADCTCCVGRPYAIRLPSGDSVAIPDSEFDFVSCFGVRTREQMRPPVTASPKAKRDFWPRIRSWFHAPHTKDVEQ